MTKQEALNRIKATPGCIALLDNDNWSIQRPNPANWDEMTEDEKDLWIDKEAILIRSQDVGGCDYGGGLVEVLALAVGLTCEGV